MIQLQPIIDRINALVAEDTEASVTYAALEARLALEKVVYDRLRQRHDYISHAQLRAWKPGELITRLLLEVDEHVTETVTLSMSRTPYAPGVKLEAQDWVKIGTEVGFDAKKITKMWQALSNLALHVRIPKNKNDDIPEYGDKQATRTKVEEAISVLKRLATSTMSSSGPPTGGNISFICTCGEKNQRRAKLLQHNQHVYCINPNCVQTWKVEIDADKFSFESVLVNVPCKACGAIIQVPWRVVTKMKYDEILKYPCSECNGTNLLKWHLMQSNVALAE